MTYADLPALIRGRCKALGLTQRDVRRLLAQRGHKVSSTTVSKWAVGHVRPAPEHLEPLLDVLAIYGAERRELIYRLAYAPSEALDVRPLQIANRPDGAV